MNFEKLVTWGLLIWLGVEATKSADALTMADASTQAQQGLCSYQPFAFMQSPIVAPYWIRQLGSGKPVQPFVFEAE